MEKIELDCAFQGHERMIRPKKGRCRISCLKVELLELHLWKHSDSFGMSKMISYGNRSDVDEADMIWYFLKIQKPM